jgi:hypothetical protein
MISDMRRGLRLWCSICGKVPVAGRRRIDSSSVIDVFDFFGFEMRRLRTTSIVVGILKG